MSGCLATVVLHETQGGSGGAGRVPDLPDDQADPRLFPFRSLAVEQGAPQRRVVRGRERSRHLSGQAAPSGVAKSTFAVSTVPPRRPGAACSSQNRFV